MRGRWMSECYKKIKKDDDDDEKCSVCAYITYYLVKFNSIPFSHSKSTILTF